MSVTPIGTVRSDFSGYAPSDEMRRHTSRIVVQPEFADGLMGLEPGDHILTLFKLHRAEATGYELRLHPGHNPANPIRGVFATVPEPVSCASAQFHRGDRHRGNSSCASTLRMSRRKVTLVVTGMLPECQPQLRWPGVTTCALAIGPTSGFGGGMGAGAWPCSPRCGGSWAARAPAGPFSQWVKPEKGASGVTATSNRTARHSTSLIRMAGLSPLTRGNPL